ncbi:hypothetical protein [Streptomyces niveus]|uniref:Uncharacterized protein n=1 Tax=Streptomyces niveus TaxID=193462 RepID=A0ABZ2AG19_STRNV|nr:hypothetical protein [Streptomyces niveus]
MYPVPVPISMSRSPGRGSRWRSSSITTALAEMLEVKAPFAGPVGSTAPSSICVIRAAPGA